MRLCVLEISRFRGIEELRWVVQRPYACLVGPGDSCKSTVLDAIELVLSPRYSVSFDDADFFNLDVSQPLEITASITDPPEELLSDAKFGLQIRGWNETTGLVDEPGESDRKVLSIRLRVDRSLEPAWVVINDRNGEGTPISAFDREKFGAARLGTYVERQLRWGRGSVLTKFGTASGDLLSALAEASRAARDSVTPDQLSGLKEACRRVQEVAKGFGIAPKSGMGFRPGLDVDASLSASGSLALCDGEVPVRRAGLGTKNLIALALQREVCKQGGITLVDEVESGLEPHRIGRLLRALRSAAINGQVLLTTHSSVAVEGLDAEDICVVRNDRGNVTVRQTPAELQDVVRSCSLALLARNVIVCEGRTEWGFVSALDEHLASRNQESFSYYSVEAVDGSGENAVRRAASLAALGYHVALLVDSDKQITPSVEDLQKCGVMVFQWADKLSIEERVFMDLPWTAVRAVLSYASELRGPQSIRDTIASRLGRGSAVPDEDLAHWVESLELRRAAGLAAKSGKWFKTWDTGQELGKVVCRCLSEIQDTDLAVKTQELMSWVRTE